MKGKSQKAKGTTEKPLTLHAPHSTLNGVSSVIGHRSLVIVLLVEILVVFLLLAAICAARVPPGDPPDERAHRQYVEFLADHHQLPVFNSSNVNYEAHQPPLYYLLAAAVYSATGRSLPALRLFSALIGAGVVCLTFLLVRTLLPEHGPALALSAAATTGLLPMNLYILSSVNNDGLAQVFSTLALWLMVLGLRDGFTVRRSASLGAALGLGLLTKTTLLPLVVVALFAVLAWAEGEKSGQSERDLTPHPPSAGPHPLSQRRGGGRRPKTRRGGPGVRLALVPACVLLATTAVIAGPWFARNTILYGDPLAARRFNQLFMDGTRALPEWFGGITSTNYWIHMVGRYTWTTFFGAFGHLTPGLFMPTWIYWLGTATLLAAGVGLVLFALRSKRNVEGGASGVEREGLRRGRMEGAQPRAGKGSIRPEGELRSMGLAVWQRQSLLMFALALIFVLGAFVQFNMTFFQAQARYLFSLIAVVALFWMLGLASLTRRGEVAPIVATLVAILSAVAVVFWMVPR